MNNGNRYFLIECHDARHNKRVYSVSAEDDTEAMAIFNDYKDTNETFDKIRETMSPYEYRKDNLKEKF